MKAVHGLVVIAGLCFTGCGDTRPESALADAAPERPGTAAAAEPVCRVVDVGGVLPDEVRESSGLAQSRRDPGLFWTHNDAGNGPDLFAVDAEGRLVRRVRLAGAEAADWEDLEAGACDEGDCLFVGDIGDNDAERERITIYRVPEPTDEASETAAAVALHARFPDGAKDAESLFVLPSGDLFVITKGRNGPVSLYRYAAPQRPAETVTLELVRELLPEPGGDDDRITAATASPDGEWVGVRSYRNLYLYRAGAMVGGGPAVPAVVDLGPLGEVQGESLAITTDGTVWLSSEASGKDGRPGWSRLECSFPAG